MTGGIVKYKDYNFRTNVDAPIINGLIIKDYIANYLKGKFPNCRTMIGGKDCTKNILTTKILII